MVPRINLESVRKIVNGGEKEKKADRTKVWERVQGRNFECLLREVGVMQSLFHFPSFNEENSGRT